MVKKVTTEANATAKKSSRGIRRSRRSPEELLSELDERRRRLEKQLYKRNLEAIFTIGTCILKAAQFDISTLSDELTEKLKNDPDYARDFIQGIMKTALENQQLG